MTQNKGGFGIGLLNTNASIGKNNLLDGHTLKVENLTSVNNSITKSVNDKDIFNDSKPKRSLENQISKKIEQTKPSLYRNDEIEEITEQKKESSKEHPNVEIKEKENIIPEEKVNDEIIKKFEATSIINGGKNNLDENDPRIKLYNLINSKESMDDYNILKSFITTPLPKRTVFRCNIVRKKEGLDKAFPKYYVHTFPNERFLMAARKRPKNSTPNYIITMNKDNFDKDDKYLGKLRSNFFGTEFNLFDTGKNPKDTNNIDELRNYIAAVEYETNLFGLKGPRKMKTLLAGLTESETINEIKNTKKGANLSDLAKKNDSRLITFRNKLPKWNESK